MRAGLLLYVGDQISGPAQTVKPPAFRTCNDMPGRLFAVLRSFHSFLMHGCDPKCACVGHERCKRWLEMPFTARNAYALRYMAHLKLLHFIFIRAKSCMSCAELGYSPEDIQHIFNHGPGGGRDGGVRSHTPTNKYTAKDNSANKQDMYVAMIQLLEYKAKKNAPQSHVTHLLQFVRDLPWTPASIARNLPQDYSSMLNCLQEEYNFPREDHVDYKICECGFIWRGSWKWQKSSNRACPTSGCACKEQDAKVFHYRPISEWVKHMYRNKDLARLLGSWQERRRQDGTACDVYDGLYYTQMCEKGHLPNGDRRYGAST